jgi:hypothetical protein
MIEVLASMAVLAIIILVIGRIFAESTKAWEVGNKEAAANNNGRAVVDYIARELSAAVVGTTNLTLKLQSDVFDTYGPAGSIQADEVYFVALSEEPRYTGGKLKRSARQLGFHLSRTSNSVHRFQLTRREANSLPAPLVCYTDPDWWQNQKNQWPSVLAENVVTFEVWMYRDDQGTLREEPNYDSATFGPPYLADIYVEMLSESDAIKADILQNADPNAALEFVNQNSKGFKARIHFNNRWGHTGDR